MNKLCLTAAVLVFAAVAAGAAEVPTAPAPHDGPTHSNGCATEACAKTKTCSKCSTGRACRSPLYRRFWDWLCYRPTDPVCGCGLVPTAYQPPVYAYFPCNNATPCVAAECSATHPGSCKRERVKPAKATVARPVVCKPCVPAHVGKRLGSRGSSCLPSKCCPPCPPPPATIAPPQTPPATIDSTPYPGATATGGSTYHVLTGYKLPPSDLLPKNHP